ncbi:MAG: hypothetical protein IKR32_00270 [Bacteroidales bacterium]|nr:hypothetical protein [Bacteroidales bacterium]
MTRQQQIIAAMNGRQAAAVKDSKLRDAVRFRLEELGRIAGVELTSTLASSYTASVLSAAAHTIIFEDEVIVALEMGAAGELPDTDRRFGKQSCAAWVTAYAISSERRQAQETISMNAARDRKRTDAVAADELRRDFQENGLRRAWDTFLEDGSWTFRPGYGAVLYDKIGRAAIGALLGSDRRAAATREAIAACRHDYPQKYRTAAEDEVAATDVYKMHLKARLARAYFETLRERALTIDYNPAAV